MVTMDPDVVSRRRHRRGIAADRIDTDPQLQQMFRQLEQGQRLSLRQFELLYGEIRAVLGSPQSLPMDYRTMEVHDRRGIQQRLRMSSAVMRRYISGLRQPQSMNRRRLVCLLCTIRDHYLT